MTFELTDELLDSIISALENQEKKFVINSTESSLVEKTEKITADDDLFYDLPEWSSKDGFSLREQFVNELHSPMARTDLQNVLRSGRGVFRGFKDVLKSYPEVEKRWHFFKNKKLIAYVNQWYNSLREIWGLEQLDYEQEDSDETENLLDDDFVFLPFNFTVDADDIKKSISAVTEDYRASLPQELCNAFTEIWKAKIEHGFDRNSYGFVCRNFSKELAGYGLFAQCLVNAPETVLLTGLFVQEKYRGLGIGKKLLEDSLSELKNRHFKWVVIADTIVPETVAPLLLRSGFKQIESGYVCDLSAD